MNYIVTKPIKSKGIAVLLVFFFGGIGLFYASITGGIIMGLVAPLAVFTFLVLSTTMHSALIVTLVIIFCCLYHLLCLIWALNSIHNYNKRIIAESNSFNQTAYPTSGELNNRSINLNDKEKSSNLWIWVLFLLLAGSLIYIFYCRGLIFGKAIKKNDTRDTILHPQEDKIKNREYQTNYLKKKENQVKTKQEKIDKAIFRLSSKMAWKVSRYYEGTDLDGKEMQSESEDKYFIFNETKIYLIINGNLMKMWHEKKEYFEDEVQITETIEGDTFSIFGDIDITYKGGKLIHYECDQIPIKSVYVNPIFLK